jgi:hypothetical protein
MLVFMHMCHMGSSRQKWEKHRAQKFKVGQAGSVAFAMNKKRKSLVMVASGDD